MRSPTFHVTLPKRCCTFRASERLHNGLQLPSFSRPGGPAEIAPRLTEIAQSAEAAGFASLWVMDHFFQLPDWGSLDDPMLESYTTLGYLAAATRKIRLGAMVTGVIWAGRPFPSTGGAFRAAGRNFADCAPDVGR